MRAATPEDIPEILRLQEQTPEAAHWSRESYAAAFDPGLSERIFFVAEENGGLVAFLVGRLGPAECEVENIVVIRAKRRQGVASRLMTELISEARRRNVEEIVLEVRQSNAAARALYGRHQFFETGRRKSYYADPMEDAILYTLAL